MAGNDCDDEGERGTTVRESADSFHRAGSALKEGLWRVYQGWREWMERRHTVIRLTTALGVWFGGNWLYNRIAPVIFDGMRVLFGRVLARLVFDPVFDTLIRYPILASIPFVTVLLAIVVAQNRVQTQKLNKIEDKMPTMTKSTTKVTDGGSREYPPTGGRAIGGAIAGGSLGIFFGPGGVLAGIYLGFIIGDRLDKQAYERDPHTDLNTESPAEQ